MRTLNTFIALVCLIVFLNLSLVAHAQTPSTTPPADETLEGTITKVISQKDFMVDKKKQTEQKLELIITDGSIKGKKIIVENGNMATTNNQLYAVGDQVVVNYGKGQDSNATYITDHVRRQPLLILSFIFVLLVIAIGRLKGFTSLISLAVSFFFIMQMILPQIQQGTDPIVIVILASLFIIPITFYLSHGLNKKTTIAIIATFVSLITAGAFIAVFSRFLYFTGFTSDEASFLQVMSGSINMKDLMLAGILIGSLGAINDITVSQAAVIFQLREANAKLTWKELYKKGMNVGQDHIGSMVNTLVLVYAGASLPLLLLFANNQKPFGQVINFEIIAVEVFRTLIGSIILVLAVPFTSLLAAVVAARSR
ncbi:YibE/F family protein [Candidatus Roizmanbacteria bacterium]|nr:YibE/F family protein [Candidatus Roizmanbacteria bacterium]